MKPNSALQTMFAVFLGLVVVAFVGIAVSTFYPEPPYPGYEMSDAVYATWEAAQEQWMLVTGIILLVLATLILVISLFLPAAQAVLSNGILLGGVFTMLYAVGRTFSADTSWLRLGVVTAALAVTIVVGYVKFARGHKKDVLVVPVPGGESSSPVPLPDNSLEVRLTAVEAKLDALGNALRS